MIRVISMIRDLSTLSILIILQIQQVYRSHDSMVLDHCDQLSISVSIDYYSYLNNYLSIVAHSSHRSTSSTSLG